MSLVAPPAREARAVHLLALLALVVGLAAALSCWPAFEALGRLAQARDIESAAFGSRATARILRRLGVLHPLPPGARREGIAYRARRPDPAEGSGAGRSARRAPRLYSVDPIAGSQLAPQLQVDPATLLRGVPTVSLLFDPEDVKALHRFRRRRGRQWERPAFFAYLEEGELRFSSLVSVRMHGGYARSSFRVYFRGPGTDRFQPSIFPGRGGQPVRELVVRRDGSDGEGASRWSLVSPLANDIARQTGCPAPESLPVAVFVNGVAAPPRALSEWIRRDWLRAHYGHDRFALVRRDAGDQWIPRLGGPQRFPALGRFLGRHPTLAEAERRVDLDNFSRWFLAILFLGTEDANQGYLALDESDPRARWFTIAWDLDLSFGVLTPDVDLAAIDVFDTSLAQRADPRIALLQGLFHRSQEFRLRFFRLFDEVMNHRLTASFLAERFAHYRAAACALDRADSVFLEDGLIDRFLALRPEVVRDQLRRHLGAPASFAVTVRGAPGTELAIDGHPTVLPYRGSYFAGDSIEVQLEDGVEADFAIDGRPLPAPGRRLVYVVNRAATLDVTRICPRPGRGLLAALGRLTSAAPRRSTPRPGR